MTVTAAPKASGRQRRVIRPAGQHVDRGGQVIASVYLQAEGHALFDDEDLQPDIGDTGAGGLRSRIHSIARTGLEPAGLDGGVQGRDQQLGEPRLRGG